MTKCNDCESEAFSRGYCWKHYYARRKDGSLPRINIQRPTHCLHPGCHETPFAKGLCSLHYKRGEHELKGVWRVMRWRDRGQYPCEWDNFDVFLASVGERPTPKSQLRRIDTSIPWTVINFKWHETKRSKFDHYTKEERSDYQRDWHLRSKFGISLVEYREMLAEQSGKCGVCGCEESFLNEKTGERQTLSLDHDHRTNQVRGLLCVGCNRGIGYMKDSPERLRAAATYLERHQPTLICEEAAE